MRAALGIVSVRGRLSYNTALPNSTDMTFDMKQLYKKEQSIVGCNSVNNTAEEMGVILRTLVSEFESGRLKAVPDEKLVKVSIGQAVEACTRVAQRSREKLVIIMSPWNTDISRLTCFCHMRMARSLYYRSKLAKEELRRLQDRKRIYMPRDRFETCLLARGN